MVKWLIIGFLLACVFIFMVQFGEIMDYDPRWDDEECEREEKATQEGEREQEE